MFKLQRTTLQLELKLKSRLFEHVFTELVRMHREHELFLDKNKPNIISIEI